jgi:23S rRNA A2030 N6-methylase RlmJ
MANAYDHNRKAGNEGDICKHPALIAALDGIAAAQNGRSTFKYVDMFAGYARNRLVEGNEWAQGIRMIAGEHLLRGNPHVALWATAAGLEKVPAAGAFYPGSSWFANTVCKSRERQVDLWLWEISPEPRRDLAVAFPEAHVFETAARPDDPAIHDADFLFIDPPDKSHWPTIAALVRKLEPNRAVLVWLPLGANTTEVPPVEDAASSECREEALNLGMGVTVVRWARGGRTIGCQLLYRVPLQTKHTLRLAVEEIVNCAQRNRADSPKWSYRPVHHG